MTIPHDLLGNKLNSFRNKKEETTEPKENNNDLFTKYVVDTINSIIIIIVLFLKSIVYGYSLKLIFQTDWNFIGFLCIGLSFNFMKQYIYNLIRKNS